MLKLVHMERNQKDQQGEGGFLEKEGNGERGNHGNAKRMCL